jgi:hypothetical protein
MIKLSKFCSIANDAEWHKWLYGFDRQLYNWFVGRMRVSRGCNDNRSIMEELVKVVATSGRSDALEDFLRVKFPNSLETLPPPFDPITVNILTYPHRHIVRGGNLQNVVMVFVADKFKYEYVIVNGVAYIEYINNDESDMVIPHKNWVIAAWRMKHVR